MSPTVRPRVAMFSSGPCAKRPGWSPAALSDALVGRSHRSKPGKQRLVDVIEGTRRILGIPADYRIGIVAASDTGAIEMALWSLLGARGVDVLAWEAFGKDWVTDVIKQLKLKDARVLEADYGKLPDLAKVDFGRDVVFTWNGTTSGVRVPNGDWISDARQGLTLCDATSAAFAMDLPWPKLDATTFSWQKALGGEAQHGMLVLSPRAIAQLERYTPAWPLPKIFRMTTGGKVNEAIFKGETINTPSMLCVEDFRDALAWADSVGGLRGLIQRAEGNLAAITRWVERTPWIDFLAERPDTRSCTSVCLRIVDPWFAGLAAEAQVATGRAIAERLDKEGVAYDIAAHRESPPGLRLWTGATIEQSDLEALFPWLEWAFAEVRGGAGKPVAA